MRIMDVVSQQYSENFRKNEQVDLVEDLPPIYLPYRFSHNLHSFLLWKKKMKILIFEKPKTRIKLFVHSSYDKWFCIKS